ncbi:HET-domain-containing protein, partial [Ophiobolus disseminans]
MPALQYTPLDSSKRSTRLLRVEKASGDAEITCELREIDLEDQPQFIALSYTWNTGGGLDSLTCNGTTVQAGKNLCDFLRRFRIDHELPLWVDALCIDQENIDERNHQVTQMASIYSSAMFTIAWLGEATGNEDFESRQYGFETRQAMIELLKRPYWCRVWIIQEFLLA